MTRVHVTVHAGARRDARRAWQCARATFHGRDAVCVGFHAATPDPRRPLSAGLTYVFVPRPPTM